MRTSSALAGATIALALGCAIAPGPALDTGSTLAAGSTLDLVVAATTDVHGRLRGWNYEANREDPVRGLARAASVVDSLRTAAPGRVVLLDAGDLMQGNSLTLVAARETNGDAPHPVIAAMNAMRYDAAAIGNHEFNYGVPFLDRSIRQSRFPFLAANAHRVDGSRAYRGWTIVEREGVRIGIVGATTPGAMVWDRDNLRDRIIIRDIVPAVRQAVGEARTAGADIVLVTMHSGLGEPATYDTAATGLPSDNVAARVAREVPGVDLIAYGHSHKELADTTINGVLLMQPKNWAQSVAVGHLGLVREAGRWRVASRRGQLVPSAGRAEAPQVLAATEAAHRATVAWVTEPIGRTTVAWRADSARVVDTPLVDFVLEVMRRTSGADLASAAAVSLDTPLNRGSITNARIQALYPYENILRAVKISGRQLRDYLEFSARYFRTDANGVITINPAVPGYNFDILAGADYTFDLSQPTGKRVSKLEVRGRSVAATDSFTLALSNYRQTGGGSYSMLIGAPVVYDKQQDIRQLLADEVKRVGTIQPDDYFTRNWRIEPAAAIPALYAQLRGGTRPAAGAIIADSARTSPRVPRPSTRLRVIGTNDFHGALEPRVDASGVRRGGAAYLAAAIRRAQAECVAPACESILVDGGDQFQGTLASNFTFGRPVTRIFNALGYAASALGNHEFDWGRDTLRARMRESRYAILGANVRFDDGRDVPWIRDDTLVVRGRLKVGVIGIASTLTPTNTRAVNVTGLRFLAPAPIVDSLARRLRARGADYVIVLAHDGAFCDRTGATGCRGEIIDLARDLREPVDAIVSGHTHSLIDATINGVPVVQARSSGTAIDIVDLGPAGTTHHIRNVLTDSLVADPQIAGMVSDAVRRVASLVNRRVATIPTELTRTGPQYPLGNLIADAMRSVAAGDIAVMNNGGIRAGLRAGTATFGSLYEIQPFDNRLYRITVTGAALRDYLARQFTRQGPDIHISGATVSYDSTRATGSQLVSVLLPDGRPLDPAARYRVVLNDFSATRGDGARLTASAIRTEQLDIVDVDALVTHLLRLPQPVRAPEEARIVHGRIVIRGATP